MLLCDGLDSERYLLGIWCSVSVVLLSLCVSYEYRIPKERAGYGKIYHKLRTILVEVDNLASQVNILLVFKDECIRVILYVFLGCVLVI